VALAGYEQAGRYAELLYRILGEEIEFVPPGIIFESDRAEWRLLKRERTWSTGLITVGAVAAVNSGLQVENPANSGLIVVVQGAGVVGKATPGTVRLGVDAAQGTVPTPNIGLDTRPPTDVLGQVSVSSKNRLKTLGLLQGYQIERWSTAGGNTQNYSIVLPALGHVLTPGHNLTLQNETVNEGLFGILWGYERVARVEELSF
jgi:hypothetical protein